MPDKVTITPIAGGSAFKVVDTNYINPDGSRGRFHIVDHKEAARILKERWNKQAGILDEIVVKRNGKPNKSEMIREMAREGANMRTIADKARVRYQMVFNVLTRHWATHPNERIDWEKHQEEAKAYNEQQNPTIRPNTVDSSPDPGTEPDEYPEEEN